MCYLLLNIILTAVTFKVVMMNFNESNETQFNLACVHPPIYTSSFVRAIDDQQGITQTTLWLDDDSKIAVAASHDQTLNNKPDLDNHDVSDYCLETSEMSIPRCTAASTFQLVGAGMPEPFRRRRDLPSYMSLRSRNNESAIAAAASCRFIDDSCLLMTSEIANNHEHDSQSLNHYYNDDQQQTYVSELPTVLPDYQPSTSSSLSSYSSSSSSSSSSSCSSSVLSTSQNNNTSPIAEANNNTSIKPPTCRSIYKYLIKRVSKRLGSTKKATTLTSSQPVDVFQEESRPVRVYAHNHKRELQAPSTSTANTSTATVAFLVHRRSNFYATNEHLREIASPIGMKNFEWNRLNCGEFFSYNV